MKNDPLRKASDKKSSPLNNNIVWLLLCLGVLTLLAVSVMSSTADERIVYSDLLELVKNSDNKEGQNYIEVHSETGDKEKTVRFSDPADIKINNYEVSGTVTRQEVPD